jgi:hypothetical protein
MTGGRFALFADCLLLGLFTALAAIPIVTAYPAFVTACTMLRDDIPVGPRTYLSRLRAVLAFDPFLWCVPTLALTIAAADAIAIRAGVPGAKPLAASFLLAAAAAVVVALRCAGRWQPEARWRSIVPASAREATLDLGGSALLLLAGACAVAIVVMVPVTALLVAGPLALATVAVPKRAHRPARRPAAAAWEPLAGGRVPGSAALPEGGRDV